MVYHASELQSHIDYLIQFLKSSEFAEYFEKPKRIIVYNLNQNKEPLSLFVNYPTQIINFPWDKYPIKDIHTFAWKSITWFKHLADFDGVFWFDSSIAPDPNNFRLLAKLIFEQIEAKSCGFFYGTATS